MKSRNLLFGTVLIGIATGCAAPLPEIDYYSVETEALERLRGITILDDASIAAGDYESLGEVKGMYCERNNRKGPESQRRYAVEQMKLRAAKLDADHVSTPVCEARAGMDMTNNCWATLTCRAKALVAEGD